MNTEIAAIREALNWLPNIDEKIHAIAMCDRLEAQAKGDEPVAWMRILHGEMSVIGPRFKSENEGDYPDYDTPLYAHPPQPSPGLSVDEVMDAMDHVGHMPDNSDHSYLWEEKFRARLDELAENKR
jgi:hypothetical protein